MYQPHWSINKSAITFYSKIIKYTLPCYKSYFVFNVHILAKFSYILKTLFSRSHHPHLEKHGILFILHLIYRETSRRWSH